MTTHRPATSARGALYPVYVPDTTTPAVLISELFEGDGPHGDYADQWVRVGGLHASVPHHATVNAAVVNSEVVNTAA